MDAHRRAQFIYATSGVCADGEVVWSWRSDAGAKVVKTLLSVSRATVATKHGHRGERRKPLKPLRRECRLLRCTLGC
jgi:hypothetical protein